MSIEVRLDTFWCVSSCASANAQILLLSLRTSSINCSLPPATSLELILCMFLPLLIVRVDLHSPSRPDLF